jgi:hypothetical protein
METKNLDKKNLPDEKETDRQREKRACRRHLRDLVKAHGHPPEDVKLKSVPVPRRIEPPVHTSYHTSPAELCSEIGEPE